MFDPNNPFVGAFDINGTPVIAPTSASSPLGQEILQRIAKSAVEVSEQGELSPLSAISLASLTARLEGLATIAQITDVAQRRLVQLDDRVRIAFAHGSAAERDAALFQLFAHHHHPEFGNADAPTFYDSVRACRLAVEELGPFLSRPLRIWYLLGPLRPQPRRDEGWYRGTLNPDPDCGHAVLEYDGRLISLCERQFDHAASYPYITGDVAGYLACWRFATPFYEVITHLCETPAEDRGLNIGL